MSISIPKSAVILVLLGGVWWLARGGDGAGDGEDGASASAPAAVDRAMRSRLELAVTSAANAADCGYTDVGYDHRTPEEAARRLVALMASAAAPAPGEPLPPQGSTVEYVEDRPGAPWQVAVRPSAEGDALLVEGYGTELSEPLFRERVPCS